MNQTVYQITVVFVGYNVVYIEADTKIEAEKIKEKYDKMDVVLTTKLEEV